MCWVRNTFVVSLFRLNNSSWFVWEFCWLIHRKRSIRVNKQWASQDPLLLTAWSYHVTDMIGTADWTLEPEDVMAIIMLGTLRENCFLFTWIIWLIVTPFLLSRDKYQCRQLDVQQETIEHNLKFYLFIKQKCQTLAGSFSHTKLPTYYLLTIDCWSTNDFLNQSKKSIKFFRFVKFQWKTSSFTYSNCLFYPING